MNPYDELEGVDELPAPPRKVVPAADLELLELAARALGAVRTEEVDGEGYLNLHMADGSIVYAWNSLVHNDDAFVLSIRLNMAVSHWPHNNPPNAMAGFFRGKSADNLTEAYGDDPIAATRRAITRVAAEIAKAMA